MRKIWAITQNTIRQGIRMKVAIILILFLFVVVPALPFLLKSDGTQHGQVRIVMTYSLTLAGFLLSVLTMVLATATLCSEFTQKQIFFLDPKPVARWQVLLGKWLGIILLDTALLAVMGGITYGLIRYIGRPIPGHEADYATIRDQVLVARHSFKPPPPDVREAVEREYKRLEEKGLLPQMWSEEWTKKHLRERFEKRANVVPPRGIKEWEFVGLPPPKGKGAMLSVRFKHHASSQPDRNQLRGIWLIGDPPRTKGYRWPPGLPHEPPMGVTCDAFHEFKIPTDAVSTDGKLKVRYINPFANQPAAIFPAEDGLEVLYPGGSVTVNFIRALLVILAKLSFLAAVGVFSATFLSFPVAVLLTLTVYAAGLGVGPITEMLTDVKLIGGPMPPGSPEHWINPAFRRAVAGIGKFLFPDLPKYNPVPLLVEGRMVTWNMILKALGVLLIIRGGIIALLGAVIFHYREVAGTAE